MHSFKMLNHFKKSIVNQIQRIVNKNTYMPLLSTQFKHRTRLPGIICVTIGKCVYCKYYDMNEVCSKETSFYQCSPKRTQLNGMNSGLLPKIAHQYWLRIKCICNKMRESYCVVMYHTECRDQVEKLRCMWDKNKLQNPHSR